MEKSTKRMDVECNKKFQEARKRADDLRLLPSRMSSGSDIGFLQGIERAALDLKHLARNAANQLSSNISCKALSRKLDASERKTSKFGSLVGKLG